MGKAATQPKLTDWWQSWENTPANASLGAAQDRLRLVYNKSLTDALVRVLTDLGQECTLGFAAVEDGGSVYLTGLSAQGTLHAVWGRDSAQRCTIRYALNPQNYHARTGLYSQEVICQ